MSGTTPPLRQDTGDLDELYRRARVAQSSLRDLLSHIEHRFDCALDIPPGLKGRLRTEQKIAKEYKGDPARVLDLARGSIIARRRDDVPRILEAIAAAFPVVKVKDRFREPVASGYMDMLTNVRVPVPGPDGRPVGIIAEMQVHWEPLYAIKNGIDHVLYEAVREIEGTLAEQGRPASEGERRVLTAVLTAERGLYANAAEPPRTPAERARAALEGRAAVAALAFAGNTQTLSAAYYANAVRQCPQDLVRADGPERVRLDLTHLGRARDMAALLQAYEATDPGDARTAAALRAVEFAHGLHSVPTPEARRAIAGIILAEAVERMPPADRDGFLAGPQVPSLEQARAAVRNDPIARAALLDHTRLMFHGAARVFLGFDYPFGHSVRINPNGVILVHANGNSQARDNPDGPAVRIPGSPPLDLFFQGGVRVPAPVNRLDADTPPPTASSAGPPGPPPG